MEKERRITAPEGCEIEKVEIVDGVAVVTFRKKERKLPKTWDEFCKMHNVSEEEFYIDVFGNICNAFEYKLCTSRQPENDKNILPDRATAKAVLALCQLIQLRNAYNGDWVPDWTDKKRKYTIDFDEGKLWKGDVSESAEILAFKSKELCDEFVRNFRPLIEKLKPLYGIKEGGEK